MSKLIMCMSHDTCIRHKDIKHQAHICSARQSTYVGVNAMDGAAVEHLNIWSASSLTLDVARTCPFRSMP